MDFKHPGAKHRENPMAKLPLGKLKAFPSTLLSVLLSFLDARIARYQSRLLQGRTKISIKLQKSAGYAVANRTRLSSRSAARHVDEQIKLIDCLRQLQWLANDHSQSLVGEIPVKRLAINLDISAAWSQINARGRSFPTSRSIVLDFCHSNLSFSISTLRL